MTIDSEPYLYQELVPAGWRDALCSELTVLLDLLLEDEPNAVVRLGHANIKSPGTVAVLAHPPSAGAIDRLRKAAWTMSGINFVDDGIGCANHFCELDWSVPTVPRPGILRRLCRWFGF